MLFSEKGNRLRSSQRWRLYKTAAWEIETGKLLELVAHADVFAQQTTEFLVDAAQMARMLRRVYENRMRDGAIPHPLDERSIGITGQRQLSLAGKPNESIG